MSPQQERVFKIEYADELLRIAEGDLDAAETLMNAKIRRSENVLYHVQQCCEKSLKAALIRSKRPVPLIHDLAALIAKLPDNLDRDFGYEISELSQFAAIRRYEEGRVSFSSEELKEAIEVGSKLFDWARQIKVAPDEVI